MLFHTTWEFVDTSEEAIRRNLALFSQWRHPMASSLRVSGVRRLLGRRRDGRSRQRQRARPGDIALRALAAIQHHRQSCQ